MVYVQYLIKPVLRILIVFIFSILFFLLSTTKVLADKTWDGGGGADTNWNTCTNWTTDLCPANDQTTDVAIFDGTSSYNVTISSNVTVKGISIAIGYGGGTITQNATRTITLGASGYSQAAGIFLGGDSLIDVNGDFILSGGDFTSTSGSLAILQNFTKINSPIFTHNSGTVDFDGAYTGTSTGIDASGFIFNKVTISRTMSNSISRTFTIASGTEVPLGDTAIITLMNSLGGWSYNLTNNGTITVGNNTFTSNIDGNFTNGGIITGTNTDWTMNGNLVNNSTITMNSSSTYLFKYYSSTGFGSLTNSATGSFSTGANPSFTVENSFIVHASSTFPTTNVTLSLSSTATCITSSSVDASIITFVSPVTINRATSNVNNDCLLTIASGTTLPLGNTATITLSNTSGWGYNFTNSGTITVGNNTFTSNIEGNFTNGGSITGTNTAWTMNGNLVNNSTITMNSSSTYLFKYYLGSGFGSLTNSATGSFSTGANPSFTIESSFIIHASSAFPTTNVSLSLNSTSNCITSSSVDASIITFVTPVTINRSVSNVNNNCLLTILAGTTLPLGNTPTLVLNNTSGWKYNFTNNGTLTTGTGTLNLSADGTFTNGGTISGSITSLIVNSTFTNNGTLTLGSLTSLDVNSYNGGDGSFTNSATGVITTAGSPQFSILKDFNINVASTYPSPITLILDGTTGTQILTIPNALTFLSFSKTGASTLTIVGNITTGGFTYLAGTISNPGSAYNLNISGDFIESSANNLGGANLPITFEGGNNQSLTKTAGTFTSSFTVNKSGGVLTITNDFATVGTTCTITQGVMFTNESDFICGSTFTVNANATLRVSGNEITITTPTLDTGSTVDYVGDNDGLADTFWINSWSYSNLTINFTDANDTLSANQADILQTESFERSTFVPPSFTTGGDVIWSKTALQYQSGANSAVSGDIGNSQTSYIQKRYRVYANTDLTFYWKVSSEANDYLLVCVNNDACTSASGYTFRISGTVDWTQVTLPLTAGINSIVWRYAKSASTSSGTDEGWIDNVVLGGAGSATATTTVTNNLTITNGIFKPSATLNIGGNYSNSGTFTHNSGTVVFNATDAGNTLAGTLSSTSAFYNLSFNGGGGTWSFTSNPAVEVANDFNILAGTVTSTSNTLTVTGNYNNSGTFTHNSGTILMNAIDGGNTLTGTMTTTSSFYDLTFNGLGGNWTFGTNSTTVANDFRITNGTVTAPSTTLTISGSYFDYGTFTHNSGIVLMNSSFSGESILENNGAIPFYDLTFNGTGDWDLDAIAEIRVDNNFTITAGTVFAPSSQLYVKGNYSNSGTFTHNSGTVFMTAVTPGHTLSGTMITTSAFSNLIFNGVSGAWTFGTNSATILNQLTITNGTVTAPSTILTITGNYSNSGTFTNNSGTVLMNATDAGNTLAGTLSGATGKFNNLTFNGAAGAWAITANPAVEVVNDLSIGNGTLTSTSNTLTIGGNLTKTGGTFTHNSGTVVFNDNTKTSTLTYNAAITFSAFTVSTASKEIYFDNIDQTNIAGTFTVNGSACSTSVNLYSDSVGNQYDINATGIVSIDYAEIKDSNAIAAQTATNSISISNNTNWTITAGLCEVIDISGICKAYDQTTDCTDTGTIKVAINATLKSEEQLTVAGTWTISQVSAVGLTIGDVITVYISGAADADEAVAVTKWDGTGTTITGMILYKEHLTIGSDDNQTLISSEIGRYDNSVSTSDDIFHDVNAGILTVDNTSQSSQEKLYILASNGYTPSSTTNTHNLDNQGTLTGGSRIINIGGSYNNSGTFDAGTSTVNMISTVGGQTLSGTLSGATGKFYTIQFNGSGGAWSFTGNPAVEVANYFNVSVGTVTSTSSTLTISGNYRCSGGYTNNGGTVLMNATDAGNTLTGSALSGSNAFYNLTFNGVAGAWSFTANPVVEVANNFNILAGTVTSTSNTLTITGNYNNSGTFTANTGTVLFNAIDAGNTLAGTLSGATGKFYNLTFNGNSGAWSFTSNPAVEVTYDLTITLGTLTSTSSNLTVGHNFTNSSSFLHNTGTILLNGTLQTISGNTTFNNLSKIVSIPDTLYYEGHVSNTTTVTGIWTMKGTIGNLLTLYSTNSPTRWRVEPSGTRDIEYLSVKDSNNVDATIISTGGLNITNEGENINWSFNLDPIAPINLAPTSLTDGSWTSDNTPTFSFDLSDPDLDTMKYQIQIDNNLNFLTPELSYTSSLSSSTNRTFISPELSDNSYYWRVKNIDSNNAESSWTVANGVLVAFKVDTTASSVPGIPSTTTPTASSTPTWSWTVSTDTGGVGLHTTPYTIEWCLDNTFVGCGANTSTSNTNSYIHTAGLVSGTWYVRVKSKDLLNNESNYSANGSVVISTEAPVGSIIINTGDLYTSNTLVNLVVAGTDNYDDPIDLEMKISDDPTFALVTYEPYSTSSTWTFENTNGTKTIYLMFRNTLGTESNVFSDTIIYDTTAPISLSYISPLNTTINTPRPEFKWHKATDTLSKINKYKVTVTFEDSTNFVLDNLESFEDGLVNSYDHSQYTIRKDGDYIYLVTKDSGLWGGSENNGILKDGIVTVKIQAYDMLGNVSFDQNTFTYDSIPPAFVLNSIDSNTNLNILPSSIEKSYTLTNNKPVFRGSVTSSESSIINILLTSTSQTPRTCSVTSSDTWECVITNALTNGIWKVYISATDSLGNISYLPTITLSITSQKVDTIVIDEPIDNTVTTPPVDTTNDNPINQPLENEYSLLLTIVDNDKNPIEGAKITLPNDNNEYITDKYGKVTINNIKEGAYNFIITYGDLSGEQIISFTGNNLNKTKTIELNTNETDTDYRAVIITIALLLLVILITIARKIYLKSKENNY